MSPRVFLAAILPFAIACSSSKTNPPAPPSVCNGHAELCARAYDHVAFPGTHDADSTVAAGFLAADQTYPIAKQLADGVRVLHLEIYLYEDDDGNDQPFLCHGACAFGKTLLADTLADVKAFEDAHPDEVLTLLMESSDTTSDAIAAAFQKSGLDRSTHAQTLGAPWPTLGELIERGERTVVFLADQTSTGGSAVPYLLPRFSFTWETPWDNQSYADFARCDADRGTKGNALYVVDTYWEDQTIPSADEARSVNGEPFLLERLLDCQTKTGAFPNFVMVNFYEVGDVFHAVDVLNGFAETPGDVDVDAFPPGDAG